MVDSLGGYRDLFSKQTIAHLATLMPDGRPHVTPVWIDIESGSDRLVVNSEVGRQKDRNVQRDPRVGVSMVDPEDAYRRVSVMGTVVERSTVGARAHIDELARRYTDQGYGEVIETERVMYRIRVERVL